MSSRTKATFLVLFVFATGVLLGAMLVFFIVQSRFGGPEGPRGRQARGNEQRQERMLGELADRLGLDPDQRRELAEVLRETRREITEITTEANAHGQEVRRKARDRIGEILDAEQFERFDTFLRRMERRWQGSAPPNRPFGGRARPGAEREGQQ